MIQLSPRLERWHAAWQSLDSSRILELYAEDAVHQSPAVRRVMPEHGSTTLAGRAAIEAYVQAACNRLRALRFEPLHVLEADDITFLEYRRIADDDIAGAFNVCEVVEWQGDRVIASRVYHA